MMRGKVQIGVKHIHFSTDNLDPRSVESNQCASPIRYMTLEIHCQTVLLLGYEERFAGA
jgi:hypothetical protein